MSYPDLGTFTRGAHEFAVYIGSNAGSLINYGERYRSGERIFLMLGREYGERRHQQALCQAAAMQWTKRGAYLLLQTRTLDGTLRPLLERGVRGLANDNGNVVAQPTTA